MTYELIGRSQVQLTVKLAVRDLQDITSTLTTVGEAMTFIDANFSPGRKIEEKWWQAAKGLQVAAATDKFALRDYATQAVIALLRSERMLDRT
jgi:hypothetical protein